MAVPLTSYAQARFRRPDIHRAGRKRLELAENFSVAMPSGHLANRSNHADYQHCPNERHQDAGPRNDKKPFRETEWFVA